MPILPLGEARGKLAQDDRTSAVEQLSLLSGVPSRVLSSAIAELNGTPYRYKRQEKKHGGQRVLRIPSPALKQVQLRLLRRLFQLWEVDDRLYAHVPGRSAVDGARVHLAGPAVPLWLVKLDLADAYDSVHRGQLRPIFERLLTLQFGGVLYGKPPEAVVDLLLDLTMWDDVLPQGAPTSGCLLNLVLTHSGLLERVQAVCDRFARVAVPLRWTWYVDDLTVSPALPTDYYRRNPQRLQWLLAWLTKAVEADGIFRVNLAKTGWSFSACRAPVVNGIALTSRFGHPRLALPRRTLERYRTLFHRASCFLRAGRIPTKESDGFTFAKVIGCFGRLLQVYLKPGQLPENWLTWLPDRSPDPPPCRVRGWEITEYDDIDYDAWWRQLPQRVRRLVVEFWKLWRNSVPEA